MVTMVVPITSTDFPVAGMPKNVPFPTRMNCSGKPETETPSVMPIAMPLKSVIVASVARIGVTSNLAIKIELMPPAISPTIIPAGAKGANDRIRVAVLGINGRGKSHIEEIMGLSEKANVEVVVLCDPDMDLLQTRAVEFEKKYGKKI